MARKFTDIEILDSLVKQFGDEADAVALSNIRAKLEEVQPQAIMVKLRERENVPCPLWVYPVKTCNLGYDCICKPVPCQLARTQ